MKIPPDLSKNSDTLSERPPCVWINLFCLCFVGKTCNKEFRKIMVTCPGILMENWAKTDFYWRPDNNSVCYTISNSRLSPTITRLKYEPDGYPWSPERTSLHYQTDPRAFVNIYTYLVRIFRFYMFRLCIICELLWAIPFQRPTYSLITGYHRLRAFTSTSRGRLV
jgi:hypothetical protein